MTVASIRGNTDCKKIVSTSGSLLSGSDADKSVATDVLLAASMPLDASMHDLRLACDSRSTSASNVESIVGDTGSDNIMLAAPITSDTIDFGNSTEVLALGNFTDSTTALNVDILTEQLAIQNAHFKIAMENMLHGLSMFDTNNQLIVSNSNYARLYNIPADLLKPGISLKAIHDIRRANGTAPKVKGDYVSNTLQSVTDKIISASEIELDDGRIVSVERRPMPGWGWVTVHMDITERKNAEKRIEYLARHDTLTGLVNRAQFLATYEQTLSFASNGNSFALALFDLDGFKEINDTFGHAAGDEVLRTVASRLSGKVADGEMVARLGGDEFAVLLSSIRDEADIEGFLRELLMGIQMPIEFEDRTFGVQASCGVAFIQDADATAATVFQQADLALYEAKSEGKGVSCTYNPEMLERRTSRKVLEMDMHVAIKCDQFELHYQPIVDLRTGGIVSMEALIRWMHPARGMISPVDFIPLAEECGLIIPIGEVVLEKACRAAALWPPHIRVSVNLSPIQFRDRTLALKIARILMESKLQPSRLELEITEAALLDGNIDNVQFLQALRKTGIRIVMDDFGTGYSSLNYLRNFPFDKIKIDRSYVHDLENDTNHSRTILNAVLAMAVGLELSTTAEGVETQQQMDILRNSGCTEMQGYFFSKPVPEAKLTAIFEQNAAREAKVA